ncbi:uncharacterized protein RHIMIDRAFT_236486 [Rhizopus microsporus ATCC 52813]|uniref:Uncharacterized protein n=1 Tax=Rhizopus microsporus ATCC 52813 TaxID=1340429 RepID=A0A2G4SXA6_RHIZD|nr:uncharacterized protein RHIMIDRAFT_236486 [Rhizopus microsporus ATCC 52813]PHZ13420.1 hypothetical protein RHIMIDRAFT_236486 [Rhizopus microsporus ATCC 52813]
MKPRVDNSHHITYCIESKSTLTSPAFCEQFDLFRRNYAYSRYKNIIFKYLPDDCDRLTKEFNLWKGSFASKQLWLEKIRLVTDFDAHLSSAEYVHDTTHRSMSPSIDGNATSIASNSDNQEANDCQDSVNTPALADSVLNSSCLVATDNENSTDDSASADMTRHILLTPSLCSSSVNAQLIRCS